MDFSKPSQVTDSECAFGYIDTKLMPLMKIVPEEFQRGKTPWNDLFNTFFFKGAKGYRFIAKPDINEEMAKRHLQALMKSWESKHEHKEAACAWVMSLWFESITKAEGRAA